MLLRRLAEKRTYGKLLPSQTLPKFIVSWFSEHYFSYRDAEAAVARYRNDVPSPQPNDSGASATSSDCYVDVDGNADRDPADLNAANEQLEDTVLKTKFTELPEACGGVIILPPSSIIDLAQLAPGRVLAAVAAEVSSSDDAIRRTAMVSERQIKYDRLATQLSSVLFENRIAVIQKKREAVAF